MTTSSRDEQGGGLYVLLRVSHLSEKGTDIFCDTLMLNDLRCFENHLVIVCRDHTIPNIKCMNPR